MNFAKFLRTSFFIKKNPVAAPKILIDTDAQNTYLKTYVTRIDF